MNTATKAMGGLKNCVPTLLKGYESLYKKAIKGIEMKPNPQKIFASI